MKPHYRMQNVRLGIMGGAFLLAMLIWGGTRGLAAQEGITPFTTPATEASDLQQELDAKREKVSNLEDQIRQYHGSIEEKKRERLTLKNQVAILEDQIAEAKLKIEKTQEEISATTLEIANISLEISELEGKIESEREILAGLVRAIFRYDDQGTLKLLLGYHNFSEFFTEVSYAQSLEDGIVKLLEDIRQKRADLSARHATLTEKKSDLDELALELQSEKDNLSGQREAKEQLVLETQEEEGKFEALLADVKQEQEQANAEIVALEAKVRARLLGEEGSDASQVIGPGGLSWPVAGREITAYFHDPTYIYRRYFEHPAIDIASPQGTPVQAAAEGVVAIAKNLDWVKNDAGKILYPAYNYVLIVHAGGISTVYGHLSGVSVSEGDTVKRGDVIGKSGAIPGTAGAGRLTTGPHLHFEVRVNGIPTNPLDYLPAS